ncbi:MAG: serine protease Do [Chthoniobacter sp.]|jgi:hypothetical protein|nr:serine protease Do [Chthoniobacter sp.]
MKLKHEFLMLLLSWTAWSCMRSMADDSAGADRLARRLEGTYWTVPYPHLAQGKDWFSLNAGGTATAGWHDMPRSWKAVSDIKISLDILGSGAKRELHFNSTLTDATDNYRDNYHRIAKPTPEMMEKVERGPASPTPKPSAEAQASPLPTLPPLPETQAGSAALIKSYRDSLVFVSGADGAGSGFIASLSGTNFLVTNAHVAAGVKGAAFRTLDGNTVRTGAGAVAVGHDIFRMQLAAGGKPFEIMQNVDENAAIGDDVVVLGNAEGAGVINSLVGKVVGVGPDLVEIDAQFVPGNSGSPIIHLKTGQVIGVATYLIVQDVDPVSGKPNHKIRRFGYRLDTTKNWQPVNWAVFNTEAATMEKIEALTDALIGVLQDIAAHKGRLNPDQHRNPAIRTAVDNLAQAERSRSLSQRDATQIVQGFFSSLRFVSQTDINDAKRRLTYNFFQRRLADQERVRTQLYQGFDQAVQRLR